MTGVLFARGDSYGGEGLHHVPASGKYSNLLIFMHGLGDTAEGWSDALRCIANGSQKLSGCTKIVLPTASSIKVTLNGGMRMPAWFDIWSLDAPAKEDEAGFATSSERISLMIEKEAELSGLSSSQVIVGGFSQGAALAYYIGLKFSKPLKAVCVCSGWLPFRSSILSQASEHSKQSKFLHCHGTGETGTYKLLRNSIADPIVRFVFGEASANLVASQGYPMTFLRYSGMGHSTCGEELDAVKSFLEDQLEI